MVMMRGTVLKTSERVTFSAIAFVCAIALGWVLVLWTGAMGKPEIAPVATYGTANVTLDMDALPSADCQYEVSMTDPDRRPGGVKTVHVTPVCP